MEKVKYNIVRTLFALILTNCYSQNDTTIRTGLIKSELTISTSRMFIVKQSYFYAHGSLEGFVSPKITLSGEGYYYLGTTSSEESHFKYNHNLFFGASRHFTKGKSDLFIGLQPGISITRLNETPTLTETHIGINPLFSTVAGYNFYVNRFFHFFIQTRLIAGEHNFDKHENLSEIRFSAGLGFNPNTMKGKL
jgi:hypothetical protein